MEIALELFFSPKFVRNPSNKKTWQDSTYSNYGDKKACKLHADSPFFMKEGGTPGNCSPVFIQGTELGESNKQKVFIF